MAAKKKKTKAVAKYAKSAKRVVVKKSKNVKSKPDAKYLRQKTTTKHNLPPSPLLAATFKVLDERQAEEIVTINLVGHSSVADYMVIASGRAARQIAAIAHYLREAFVELGMEKVRVEGLPQADWVLVDGGDIVVHLFRPEVRKYYDIESIWEKHQV